MLITFCRSVTLVMNLRVEFHCVQPLDSIVMSLRTFQEVLGLIPGSALGYFSGGELLQSMYGLGISVLVVHVLSCVVFGRGSCILLTVDQRDFAIVSVVLCVGHTNFLYQGKLTSMSLGTEEAIIE